MPYVPRPEIHQLLENAVTSFHSAYHRERDPISLVYRYSVPADQEIAAFFAALLAYGNVRSILNSVTWVLESLGDSPRERLLEGNFHFGAFYHRFTKAEDIEILSHWVAGALKNSGSLEGFFLAGQGETMQERLSSFVRRLTSQPLPGPLRPKLSERARNLKYLLSDPLRGSACKRLNMYLRWMVRRADGIDLGLWNRVSPRNLVLPIDTHLLKTLHALRWTRSPQASWKVAEHATTRLRAYCPEDPIKYDFALCHLSMSGTNVAHYFRRPRATLAGRPLYQEG